MKEGIMNDERYEKLKELHAKGKLKLKESAEQVHSKSSRLLAKTVGLLKFHENLTVFNEYLCNPANDHNHTQKIIPTLRNYIVKRSDVSESIREEYLTQIFNHIELHNKILKIRIELKHQTINVFSNELLMKKYETLFVDDEGKKRANLDLIKEALHLQLEEKNGGKPVITSITFFEYSRSKDKPSTKPLLKLSYRDLIFNNYGLNVEFSNGESRKMDLYKDAIYYKDLAHGVDGKLGTYEIYKGEKSIPDSPEAKEDAKEDIINQIINDKENSNDEPIN